MNEKPLVKSVVRVLSFFTLGSQYNVSACEVFVGSYVIFLFPSHTLQALCISSSCKVLVDD